MAQIDNSTFIEKKTIRLHVLNLLDGDPIVMETHGGSGMLFDACYRQVRNGVVFETNSDKVARLGLQRPEWRVYEANSEQALTHGVAGDMPVNILDIDPYGEPWPFIDAFFLGNRHYAEQMTVVVNDGLRQKLRIGAASVRSMQDMVLKYGNKLASKYLEICRELLTQKAGKVGYNLTDFRGYYCGNLKNMTHYYAVLNMSS